MTRYTIPALVATTVVTGKSDPLRPCRFLFSLFRLDDLDVSVA